MGEEPEYDVAKDPRTGSDRESRLTLALVESDSRPDGADQLIRYGGHYYALRPETGCQWNKKAFCCISSSS